KGRVKELAKVALPGTVGIGHTRWATHGEPSKRNAHPHRFGRFALVHNGIVENEAALRQEGERYLSDTDSEVIVHLMERYYLETHDLLLALRRTTERLEGTYALAILSDDHPGILLAAAKGSPLIVGLGEGETFLASDIPALAGYAKRIIPLSDGEMALLTKRGVTIRSALGEPVEKASCACPVRAQSVERCGFETYMEKEIAEGPRTVRDTLRSFDEKALASLGEWERIRIVGCGTAYHSGIAGKCFLERLAHIETEVSVASEYRYSDLIVSKGTLVVAVSQSGETADTIAAAKLAKERGAKVLAVTNAPVSSLVRMADGVLYTRAGPEIGVAATKSYLGQLAIFLRLASLKGNYQIPNDLPLLCKRTEALRPVMKRLAKEIASAKTVFFLGRGIDHAVALEGSLKLKEVTKIPSEGYPAGELKHGPLALVEEGTPVIVILTDPLLAEKTFNAVREVQARGARVILVTTLAQYADRVESVLLPPVPAPCSALVSILPLQMLACYTAKERGLDPDKPKNLAKSVTVE
ncbi:MAG: glutamine--fructose-6-phosphate transaminase (isomerizing), partial [Christensenellaceae bacterium]